jgi:hypothetical protein
MVQSVPPRPACTDLVARGASLFAVETNVCSTSGSWAPCSSGGAATGAAELAAHPHDIDAATSTAGPRARRDGMRRSIARIARRAGVIRRTVAGQLG